MPASWRIGFGLLLLATFGAAAVGWRSRPADSGFRATLVRASDYGPRHRIVILQLTNCGLGTFEFRAGHQNAQAKVGELWIQPRELHGLDSGVNCAFVSPLDATACRLSLEFRREALAHRVQLFFHEQGLEKRFPSLCDKVALWFPKSKTRWRHAIININLPNHSQSSRHVPVPLHNEPLQAMLVFGLLFFLAPAPSAPEFFRSAE